MRTAVQNVKKHHVNVKRMDDGLRFGSKRYYENRFRIGNWKFEEKNHEL